MAMKLFYKRKLPAVGLSWLVGCTVATFRKAARPFAMNAVADIGALLLDSVKRTLFCTIQWVRQTCSTVAMTRRLEVKTSRFRVDYFVSAGWLKAKSLAG